MAKSKIYVKISGQKTRSRLRPIHKKLSLKPHAFSFIGIFIDWMIENSSNVSFSHFIKNIVVNDFEYSSFLWEIENFALSQQDASLPENQDKEIIT